MDGDGKIPLPLTCFVVIVSVVVAVVFEGPYHEDEVDDNEVDYDFFA